MIITSCTFQLPVDKSRLLCIEKNSTKEAVSILLDQIIASEELGKWTMFLDALKRTGTKQFPNCTGSHSPNVISVPYFVNKYSTPTNRTGSRSAIGRVPYL